MKLYYHKSDNRVGTFFIHEEDTYFISISEDFWADIKRLPDTLPSHIEAWYGEYYMPSDGVIKSFVNWTYRFSDFVNTCALKMENHRPKIVSEDLFKYEIHS